MCLMLIIPNEKQSDSNLTVHLQIRPFKWPVITHFTSDPFQRRGKTYAFISCFTHVTLSHDLVNQNRSILDGFAGIEKDDTMEVDAVKCKAHRNLRVYNHIVC